MLFTETALKGAYIIEVERLSDARGSFDRCFLRRSSPRTG